MGAIVASLEAQGLADRAPDSSDGRQSIISVSDAGQRALDDARAVKQDWLAERLANQLTQHEQRILAQAISLLQRIVDTPPGGPR
jgi:DNA-binding MarR family transcriptional regulator